jgi:predicted ester cyclase
MTHPDHRPIDELIDGWQAAWSHDGGGFADVCASGVAYEDPMTDHLLQGVDELESHAARLWAGFPDARLERTGDRVFNGGFVAAPCKLLGTHRAPLGGLPATGRFLVVHCVFYCELQHDLLLRVRGFYDVYDAATQLGVLPGRGTLGGKALLMLRGFGLRASRGGV